MAGIINDELIYLRTSQRFIERMDAVDVPKLSRTIVRILFALDDREDGELPKDIQNLIHWGLHDTAIISSISRRFSFEVDKDEHYAISFRDRSSRSWFGPFKSHNPDFCLSLTSAYLQLHLSQLVQNEIGFRSSFSSETLLLRV